MHITNKKWIQWVFGILCIGALLLVAIVMALPNLVRLSSVHKNIETYLARQLQGQLTYENMVLAYFPRPCFRIKNVSITIPYKLTGSVDYVNVTPSLLSLLIGQIRVAGIDAVNPNCKLEMTSPKGLPTFRLEEMNRIITRAENMPSALQGLLKVSFKDGRVAITKNDFPVFSFQNINGTYRQSPSSVQLKASGSGDLWEKADVDVCFNVATQFGEGSLDLKGFKPHYLTAHLWPDAAIRIIDAHTNALCDFTFNTTGHLNLSLQTDKPAVTLQKEDETLQLTGNAVSAAILLSEDLTKISITNADLTYPELKAEGHFLIDKNRPHAEWLIQAKDIDIPSLRRTSDFTVGNFQIARILSNVIRDGYVSEFSIQDHADDPAGLTRPKNLKLHGLIENGHIFVPGAALHLKNVKGDVRVSKGVLTAKPITAQLGNSTGKDGYFSLDLGPGPGEKRQFDVDCNVEADLNQLPPLLQRLIPNAVFKQEMANITSAKGNALGKLVIKRKDKLSVDVNVSSFDLKGAYARIPYPISLQGGEFIYREGNIQLQNINGSVGASTLSKFNATLDWEKEFTLAIPSGTSTINTDEIYPWLLSYTNVRDALKRIQSLSGKISIQKMKFKGPLFSPKKWQYSFTTQADNLYVGLPLFEEPILCCGGGIIIEPNILYFENTHVSVLDADAKITGDFTGYLEDKQFLDAYFHGDMSKEMSHWIQRSTAMPNDYKWQTPLSVSNMHLVWQENRGFKVALQASLADDLSVDMDLSHANNELMIKHLSIQDSHSKADICIFREKEITDIEFNGKLTATTLDRLLVKNTFLSGAIQGDCNARIIETAPHESTVYGKLHINGLQFYRFNWPLQIEQLSIEGKHQRIDIAQARLIWEDSLVFLSGSAEHYDQGLQLNGKLIADRLDWQQIVNTFQKKAGGGPVWPIDIYGTLEVSAGTFRYSDTMALGPFESTLHFNKNTLTATLEKAELCGISIPGSITMSPTQKTLSLMPTASDQNLALPFACIGDNKVFMDGRFSIASNINANIKENAPIGPACNGDVIFTAKDGRIYKFSLLAKIFTLLNVAGLVAGDFPDLEKEGFPYKTATVKGIFNNGVLELEEGVIDSPAMKIFFHGKENYLKKKHDMTIVVAPLKTVDMVVDKIPVVKEVLNKGFVIYPVKVTGSWGNPKLQPVSTEAVGMEILGIIGRTLNLPATLLKKVLPSEKK